MTAPNRSTLWGRAIVDELAAAGVEVACVAPGSRSTPLVVALSDHADVEIASHLDERSMAYYALGRSRGSGEPTAVVTTSGTAAANLHPAVIEAHHSRVPLVVLTADRPAELSDSGANQTIDQHRLYGDAVRDFRTLPEPAPESRRLRSLRVAVARAVAASTGSNPGPVHCNVPLPRPLEPTDVPGDVPEDFAADEPLAATGRDGPMVRTTRGRPTLDPADLEAVATTIDAVDRGLLVCGPANGPTPDRQGLAALAEATGFPILADPLSGHRFGPHVPDLPIVGGYDAYLDRVDWPSPDVVVRFGASPTSKVLRRYLRDTGARQFVVDPAGGWPEAEFAASDLVVADPDEFARSLAADVSAPGSAGWRDRFSAAEAAHWDLAREAAADRLFEGGIAHAVAATVPDPATLYVSNSMPVRDLDRFGEPRAAAITALGNRGASGIDGITSSALGAAAAADEPVVLLTGDLAYYHDMNGLLALARCDVDATVILVNNDGGGIFHMLPIEDVDPPFTEQFKTPHGLDFAPTADLYDLTHRRVGGLDDLRRGLEEAVGTGSTTVLEVAVDAESSHRLRESLAADLADRL